MTLFCMIFLFSCKDHKENRQDKKNSEQQEYLESDDTRDNGSYKDDRPLERNIETPDSGNITDGTENRSEGSGISGIYLKNDHPEDRACSCYCIDVKMTGTSELCLSEGELYINGRFEKSGTNINIYYTGKASRTSDTEIPWDKFEKNTPIATLNPTSNGFDLDWKGFSINGEIAVDYALYGKKTLEGTYKKK